MFYIITKSIRKMTEILFYINIILLFSYLTLSAEKKGTIEMLIKGWEETKILCDKENNTHKKQNFCIEQYQFELALKTKGLCRGAHTLKLENDTKRDNQLYKDQYKVFEKTVRNKWVPCVFGSLLENEEEAFNTDGIEKQHWLEAREDGSFKININMLFHHQDLAYVGCRGGGEDIERVIGDCRMRGELVFLLTQVGLCPCSYSHPNDFQDIEGIWPFRDLWVPCIYQNSTGRLMC